MSSMPNWVAKIHTEGFILTSLDRLTHVLNIRHSLNKDLSMNQTYFLQLST